MSIYSLREAAEISGVSYKQLWYAVRVGEIRERQKVGRYRLFDDYDIVEIKRHFGNAADGIRSETSSGII